MAWNSPIDREPLDRLLSKHHEAITGLRASLWDELLLAGAPAYADDVWLLRYVLSFDGLAPAAAAGRQALRWRQQNQALISAAAARTPPEGLGDDDFAAIDLFIAAAFHGTSLFGDPVYVSRAGSCNLRALMDRVPEATMELWFTFVNECVWQYCEQATRRNNVFVKQITIQDLTGALFNQERRFLRVMGRSSKVNEWLRPQLIGKTYIFNSPVMLSVALKVAASFMSRSSLEKVWAHPQRLKNSGPRRSSNTMCPFAQTLLGDLAELPRFLGGFCEREDAFPAAPRHATASADGSPRWRRLPLCLARLPLPPRPAVPEEGPKTAASSASSPPESAFATPLCTPPRSPRSPRALADGAGAGSARGAAVASPGGMAMETIFLERVSSLASDSSPSVQATDVQGVHESQRCCDWAERAIRALGRQRNGTSADRGRRP